VKTGHRFLTVPFYCIGQVETAGQGQTQGDCYDGDLCRVGSKINGNGTGDVLAFGEGAQATETINRCWHLKSGCRSGLRLVVTKKGQEGRVERECRDLSAQVSFDPWVQDLRPIKTGLGGVRE